MRLGEAWQTEWKDLDTQNHTIVCNSPEKNSKPRAFIISIELTQMLQNLPHNSQYIFTCQRQPITKEERKRHLGFIKRQKSILNKQRQRVADKLKNPRIALIHYHSLRHWKATNMKHQGYDLFDIAAFLGHRNIKNTVIYVHLEKTAYPNGCSDDYTSKATKNQTEALSLIEAGFEMLQIAPDGTIYSTKVYYLEKSMVKVLQSEREVCLQFLALHQDERTLWRWLFRHSSCL